MKKLIGTVTKSFGYLSEGEKVYIEKHSWDCDWYWGFGYVGNKDLHTHFDSTFLKGCEILPSTHLKTTLTDKQWWIIRDLFIQAYSLKQCAEKYRHGGYQTTVKDVTDILKDDEMCKRLNEDLKKILDMVWDMF